jgi:hypothetical protein
MSGRCLCGAVTIMLAGDHKEVGACHCDMCRRWGGGPGMAIEIGKDIEIEGRDRVRIYRSSKWAERAFCDTCGSSLYYRLVKAGDHYLFAGILDDQSAMVLTSQIFIDEKPAYYTFANETKTMTGAEVFAAFPPPADKEGS